MSVFSACLPACQKKVSDPITEPMLVLGIELRSFVRIASALNMLMHLSSHLVFSFVYVDVISVPYHAVLVEVNRGRQIPCNNLVLQMET